MAELEALLGAERAAAQESARLQQRTSEGLEAQLEALRGRMGLLREEMASEVEGATQGIVQQLRSVDERWQQHAAAAAAAHEAASTAAAAAHEQALTQAEQRIGGAEQAASELLQAQQQLAHRLLGVWSTLAELLAAQGAGDVGGALAAAQACALGADAEALAGEVEVRGCVAGHSMSWHACWLAAQVACRSGSASSLRPMCIAATLLLCCLPPVVCRLQC